MAVLLYPPLYPHLTAPFPPPEHPLSAAHPSLSPSLCSLCHRCVCAVCASVPVCAAHCPPVHTPVHLPPSLAPLSPFARPVAVFAVPLPSSRPQVFERAQRGKMAPSSRRCALSGKGITISSIGVLLKSCGLRVTSIKIDPYLVSEGTSLALWHSVSLSLCLSVCLSVCLCDTHLYVSCVCPCRTAMPAPCRRLNTAKCTFWTTAGR